MTTSTAPRHMRFVQLTLDEIDGIRASGNETEIAFLGICVGAFITLSVTLATVALPDFTKGIFVVLVVVFALASAYFGANAVKAHSNWKRKYKRYEQMAQPGSTE